MTIRFRKLRLLLSCALAGACCAWLTLAGCDVTQDVGESNADRDLGLIPDASHDAHIVVDSGGPSNVECTNLLVDADGCDSNSVCVNEGSYDVQRLRCHAFPPCPSEGNCPVGSMGATCGDAIYSSKTPMCIPNMCRDATNCPESWHCVHSASFSVVGFCSSGGFYMPCATDDDCVSPLTCQPTGSGLPGLCT